ASRPELIDLTVHNGSTGETIPGARVVIDGLTYASGDDGTVTFERPGESAAVEVSATGFIPLSGEITEVTGAEQTVSLRPSTLSGRVSDESTGEPIAAATVAILDAAGNVVASTQTDESGAYRLTDLPDGASVQVDAGVYGTLSQEVGANTELSFPLALTSATGIVVDEAGEPLQGAMVRSGEATSISGGDGTYSLEGVANGSEVTLTAPGFESVTAPVANGAVEQVQMTPQLIKAVYANVSLLTTEGGLDSLIEIANTTEVNAIVIDVKEGSIFYDSEVEFFDQTGTIRPFYDLDAILARLAENDIYAIARMVVFQDPLVAEARPDLAVQDVNGGLWVNEQGVAWVSAFEEELWDANIALSVELIERGFAEVQYDYVRFPSDGDLSTADFGPEYTAENREAAITEFVKRSHEAINAAGGMLAADLFGFVTIVDEEQYIGQRFSALAPHLDFVCMMIYPSHFEEGNIASAPGHPNDYPYETIYESLERAEANAPGSSAKFRPWLQDFSYGYNDLRDYTADDVRAQIDAAEEFGASGWMLWGDPFNVTVEALEPEPAT
nr:carboxypeptidase regulatory-like domain-containing protein [Chloroflexia bacterium]